MGLIATNTNDFNFMLSSIVEKASTLVIEPIDYAQTGDSPAMHGFAFRYSSIQKLLRDYKVLLYSNLIEIVDSIETVLTLDASIEEVFTGYENRDTSVVVDLSDTVTTYSEYSTLIYYAPQTASFDVRYVDMQHFFAVSNPEIERLIVDVEGLITSISNFANSDVIVGEGATSIKNFLVEVHVEILMLIKNILLLYAEIMGRYSKEYIDRGENDLYVIAKSELEEYKLALNTKKNEYETHASSIKSIICTNVEFSSRDDLPKYDISYNTRIEIDNLISYIDSVIDFVEQIEEGYRTELENGQLSEVSAELITAIQNVQVSSGYEVLSYDISNIVGVDSIEVLRQYNSAFNERTDEILNQSYRDLATLVAEGGGVYEEAAMEEAIADARMDALSSALILVVAGAAAIMAPIVFCASPLVIAAGIGIGGASVVSGLSTTGEIVYEVYNPGEEGFNLVRDIYFGGDQRAFDIYNEVLLSADASIIGASLFGGNTAIKDIAFDVISEVSGIAVGEIASINGASETEQALLIFATSIATSIGLNSVDDIISRQTIRRVYGEYYEQIVSAIEANGTTVDKFLDLMRRSSNSYSPEEAQLMERIRNSIDAPSYFTMMQKIIDPALVQSYISGDFLKYNGGFIGGSMARYDTVSHLRTPRDLFEGLRLEYTGSPFTAEDSSMYALRFYTYDKDKLFVPYGQGMPHPEVNVNTNLPPPFTGNGFTSATNGSIIPEYMSSGCRMTNGAQLVRINSDGTEELLAVFDGERFNII